MVYIDSINDKKDFLFYFPNKKFYLFYKIFSKIKILKYEEKEIIILPNLKNSTLVKLERILNQKNSQNICVSEKLKENEDFMNFIISKNRNVLDKKFLFLCLTDKILNYIEEKEENEIINQEIAILCPNFSKKIAEILVELCKKYKKINLVTKKAKEFIPISKHLLEEYGIDIGIKYNERQSLKKADIILNYGFSEKVINKFVINRNAIIINFKDNISLKNKNFDGIIVNSYKIYFPYDYFEYLVKFQRFAMEDLYESFLYNTTQYKNILDKIEKDKLKIRYLIGVRGRIEESEFKNIKICVKP